MRKEPFAGAERRVYPAGRSGGRWLVRVVLMLSCAVVMAGVWGRFSGESGITVARLGATPTPTLDAALDRTEETREITWAACAYHALQIGAFDNEEAARTAAEALRARGAAGFLWHEGRFRVLASLYADKADAQVVRRQLEEQHSLESWLYPIEKPAVTLRVTGMRGQLDALEAAFGGLFSLLAQAQSLSVAVDRQDMTAEEATAAANDLRAGAERLRALLAARFPTPRHALAEGLIASLANAAAECDAVAASGERGIVHVGASVKHLALSMLYDMTRLYASLGAPTGGA